MSSAHAPLAALRRPAILAGAAAPTVGDVRQIAIPKLAASARASSLRASRRSSAALENAARHGCGAVEVTVRRNGAWVAIDVADEGDGRGLDPDAVFVRRSGNAEGPDASPGIRWGPSAIVVS